MGLGLAGEILAGLKDENGKMSGRFLGPDYDYDLAGSTDERGHYTDKGKLPNHPTFSKYSNYANKKLPGGEFVDDFQGTRWVPSARQSKAMTPKQYADYLKFAEKGQNARLDLTRYVK